MWIDKVSRVTHLLYVKVRNGACLLNAQLKKTRKNNQNEWKTRYLWVDNLKNCGKGVNEKIWNNLLQNYDWNWLYLPWGQRSAQCSAPLHRDVTACAVLTGSGRSCVSSTSSCHVSWVTSVTWLRATTPRRTCERTKLRLIRTTKLRTGFEIIWVQINHIIIWNST